MTLTLAEIAELVDGSIWPESLKPGLAFSEEGNACGEWFHPRLLAQLLVMVVKERVRRGSSMCCIELVLKESEIPLGRYERIKEKLKASTAVG